MNYKKRALDKHKELRGKISVELKDNLDTLDQLSTYYTPGVGSVSKYIAENPDSARDLTWLNNSVAVISDGSSVLGLGNIGPQAALPVMEGKCMLFKKFAGIDAVPIVLKSQSIKRIEKTIKQIAPSFGGINLEDIAAPKCFEIENNLKNQLDIPIMHDDQHGTAIVVLAGLINALKIGNKNLAQCTVVVNGVGAAGVAIIKLIHKYEPKVKIIAVDSKGIIGGNRKHLDSSKKYLLERHIIIGNNQGGLKDAMKDADIFVGVSRANVVDRAMVGSMNKDPIIFAMANPDPEIHPDEAKKAGACVVATGRSDFPNQVNNALAFPGIFRGALDNHVNRITNKHKIDAAKTIAGLIKNPSADHIIPSVLDERIVPAVAKVI
ncbi:MAG: NADP-dependent malic enzyme, partial [Candidatus Saccharimonadales bacterium]